MTDEQVKYFKLFLSLSATIFTGYLIVYSALPVDRIWLLIVINILILVVLYFDDISSFRFGKDGIEVQKREFEVLKKEAEITIEKLQELMEPILTFNLALIEKDGSFDNVTDFNELVSFINDLDKLSRENYLRDDRVERLFNLAMHKLVYAFQYKADGLLNDGISTRKYLVYGGHKVYEDPLETEIKIGLNELKTLSSDKEYVRLIEIFEVFVRRYIPESIV